MLFFGSGIFFFSFSLLSLLTFTDTFFTLDVYLGHGDAVRVVDPELGKLERENVGHELPHGISLNTPILGTTSTSTRRHTRRESNPGEMRKFLLFLLASFSLARVLCAPLNGPLNSLSFSSKIQFKALSLACSARSLARSRANLHNFSFPHKFRRCRGERSANYYDRQRKGAWINTNIADGQEG